MGKYHNEDLGAHLAATLPSPLFLKEVIEEDDREFLYRVYRKRDRQQMASFRAGVLPGCCGVVLVYYLNISPQKSKDQQMVTANMVVESIERAVKSSRSGMVLMTLVKGSDLVGVLESRGWISSEFVNGKTDNAVVVLMKDLGIQKRTPLPEVLNTRGE